MPTYAENTTVSVDNSRSEIERTLKRYGADSFMYGWEETRAMVCFKLNGRSVRFVLPLPDKNSDEFTQTVARKRKRNDDQIYKAWEQACRQRWRALALAIKAKLESVQTGITTFDEEFLAHIVLPGGTTVGEQMIGQIQVAYDTGKIPKLLPLLPP